MLPLAEADRSSGLTVGVGVFGLKKPISVLCDGPGPDLEDVCFVRVALVFFVGLAAGAGCSARRFGRGDVCDNAGSVVVDWDNDGFGDGAGLGAFSRTAVTGTVAEDVLV